MSNGAHCPPIDDLWYKNAIIYCLDVFLISWPGFLAKLLSLLRKTGRQFLRYKKWARSVFKR
jgi:hypothetical protein